MKGRRIHPMTNTTITTAKINHAIVGMPASGLNIVHSFVDLSNMDAACMRESD
jgi:hypothetical protein